MAELPLHLVTFWWDNPNAKHRWNYQFTAEHVDRLFRGWKRNLTLPFHFHCFVDGRVPARNIAEQEVVVHEMPRPWLEVLERFGRAYPKLGIFSWEMRELFGPARLLTLDLDMCVTGNCDHLLSKDPAAPFIGYMDTKNPRLYSGAMHLHRAGECRQIWDTFRMVRKIDTSAQEMTGSDQMWITSVLGENAFPRWTEEDGVYDYWRIEDRESLPGNACLVMVNGMHRDVSLPQFQEKHAWLRENWV